MGVRKHRVVPLLAALQFVAVLLSGWTPALRAQPAGAAAELVLGAIGLIGVPYRYGGDDPSLGLDCSGLVRFVVRRALGVQLPRQSEAISRMGAEVGRQELQPGDLVFFNTLGRPYSHLGVYLGDDRFVHAPARQGQVRVEQMTQPYWRNRFNGARRLELLAPDGMTVVVAAVQKGESTDAADPLESVKP